jgi:uncharacterized protein YuzE
MAQIEPHGLLYVPFDSLDVVETPSGTYDAEADAAYLNVVAHIGDGEAVEQEMIDRPEGYDFDQHGRLLGVEVIGARAQLRAETLNVLRRIDV